MTPAARVALATLLFHRGGPWRSEDHTLWRELTGGTEGVTSAVLCALAREVLAHEIGPNYTDNVVPLIKDASH